MGNNIFKIPGKKEFEDAERYSHFHHKSMMDVTSKEYAHFMFMHMKGCKLGYTPSCVKFLEYNNKRLKTITKNLTH